MSIDVRHGDCLDVLRDMPDNSVDSILTDPPYGLSNMKPAQVADVLKAWVTGDTLSVPAKRGGFMGKDWDSFVPPPAVWQECLRVLKPGGHMAVFAGARTQDLMGLSIRLAGFEIRDNLGWIYGSGFPKSQDVGKMIDKKRQKSGDVERFSSWLTAQMEKRGINRQELDEVVGSKSKGNLSHHWTTHPTQRSVPPAEMWGRMFHLFDPLPEWAEPLIMPARKPGEAWEKREVISERPAYGIGGNGILNGHSEGAIAKVTAPATSEAQQWDGWGTALKPAIEPITLARKPLDGAVASNVLLDEQSDDSSRFFPAFKYQAKASKKERPVIQCEGGSKVQHPTVKPVALMEWLVTLITPPNGVVLDPFAGSGSTLEATRNKGFNSIGIELEADYIRLIEARLDHQRAS